jgi:hypothetical protein
VPASARGLVAGTACLLLAGCVEYVEYDEFPNRPLAAAEAADARNGTPRVAWRRSRTLLAAPRKPECDAEAAGNPPIAAGDGNADLALRIKLEYERECYRQAELRTRRQLKALQAAVSEEVAALPPGGRERRGERPLQ